MKIANIGFLLTIEVLQAVSHPSDWKEVQAGSSASVNQQIPTKTNRAVCSFMQQKISLGHFTVYMEVRMCYLQLRAYIKRKAQGKACSSSSWKASKDSAQVKCIYPPTNLGKIISRGAAVNWEATGGQLKGKMKNNLAGVLQCLEVSQTAEGYVRS